MPNIELRYGKDMLVLSSPLEVQLARRSGQEPPDIAYLLLCEPETLVDALRGNALGGVQVAVVGLEGITPLRLLSAGIKDDGPALAASAVAVARELSFQHVLAEIGPCGLPLDASSLSSLKENRSQYARGAAYYANKDVDGIFLNGFCDVDDLSCALQGAREVYGGELFASVNVGQGGVLGNGRHHVASAIEAMVQNGASVAGIGTAEPLETVLGFVREARNICDLPLLTQLFVPKTALRSSHVARHESSDCSFANCDAVVDAALRLRAEGVQFLRAAGFATAAYAGALAVVLGGMDVLFRNGRADA